MATHLTPIPTQQTLHEHKLLPALHVLSLGRFEVLREDQPLALCQNRCGQAILRYYSMRSPIIVQQWM